MSDHLPPGSASPAEAGNTTNAAHVSGGADLNAGRDITIGGDVVGRDKITTYITGDQQYDVHGLANPYLGLQSFTYADHVKYAGREKLIAETVAHLVASDEPLALLFVTGASGSGKSSFVQAGVLPALEKHYAALSVKWAVFRPSRDPLAGLADALWRQLGLPQFDALTASPADFDEFLRKHTPQRQVNVIVIDQFEELFTQSNAQPRDALFDLLTHLPPFRATHTHIIATVRADYLPELFALPTLYDIAKRGIDLRVMSVDELGNAIQQPLRAAYPDKDKRFQAELVERLAHDSAEDAAYLPLLQVTLEEIWRKGALTVGSYSNLADAIKQRADKVLAHQDYDAAQPDQPRSPAEQAAILNLCLDLVDVSLDDEARRDVRRRRSKDELVSGAPDRARLIDALTQARLLSVEAEPGEQSHIEVDIIHETLLSNWDRLKQAIAERRHDLRQRVRFEQQLKEWIGQNRLDDYLLGGVRLAEARDLERRDDIALRSAAAKEFVQHSIEREEARRQKELDDARKLAEAEAQRAESEKQRAEEQTQSAAKLRRVLIVVGLLAFAAIVLGVLAGVFGVQSNESANANATLAAQNASVASTAQAASTQAVSEAQIRATAEISASIQRDEAQRQAQIALSRQLAVQGIAQLDGRPDLALLLGVEAARAADTAEARQTLLTALARCTEPFVFLHGPTKMSRDIHFSSDGKILVASTCEEKTGGGEENIRCVLWDYSSWEASTGQRLSELPANTPWAYESSHTYESESPDGRLRASIEIGRIHLSERVADQWQSELLTTTTDIRSVAFSPDGKLLAAGDDQGEVIIWDTASWQQVNRLATYSSGAVEQVNMSPDNKILMLVAGGKASRWDVASHTQLSEVVINPNWLQDSTSLNPDSRVAKVLFSPDGETVVTSGCAESTPYGCARGELRLWNEAFRQRAGVSFITDKPASIMALSPDGKMLLSHSEYDDQTVLRNVTTQESLGTITGTLATFSPDGETIVSSSGHDLMQWDMTTRQMLRAPVPLTNTVHSLVFSSDGKLLAIVGSWGNRGAVILWDVLAWRPIGELANQNSWATDVAFSPDGKTLVTGHTNGDVVFWDVTQQRRNKVSTSLKGEVFRVVFDPDGKTAVSVNREQAPVGINGYILGVIQFWNAATGQPVGEPLTGRSDLIKSIAFSPDGKTLATGSYDGVYLWDVRTRQLLGRLSDEAADSLVFGRDGNSLISGSVCRTCPTSWITTTSTTGTITDMAGPDKGVIDRLDLRVESWQARACRIANRNLTRAEWQQYLGDEPYRKTCEQWPPDTEATPTPQATPTP